MKSSAAFLAAAFLALSAFAGARVVVLSLPEAMRPLAEVETNVVFDAGAAGDNLWRLSIDLESAVSNSVEVVFGTDADGDGVLGVEEGELAVGWRCGRWCWRDRLSNVGWESADACGSRRLDWTVRMSGDRAACSVTGNVFDGELPPTCFNAAWNVARVVARGADAVQIESKVSVDALNLRVR